MSKVINLSENPTGSESMNKPQEEKTGRPLTNYEKIKRMSIEEMSEFLRHFFNVIDCSGNNIIFHLLLHRQK